MPQSAKQRFEQIASAFKADGFDLLKVKDPYTGRPLDFLEKNGRIGVAAAMLARGSGHVDPERMPDGGEAQNPDDPWRVKKAYYVEGQGYTRGWLLGCMTEPEMGRMCREYVPNVIFDFLNLPDAVKNNSFLFRSLKKEIIDIITDTSLLTRDDIPDEYVDEIHGMVCGALLANEFTDVNMRSLWALNYGIDCLVAHIYSESFRFKDKKIGKYYLTVPFMCNAFTMGGSLTKDGKVFFGRDFMFPLAGVFQDVGCLVIGNPHPRAARGEIAPDPHTDFESEPRGKLAVSMLAPGMAGAVCSMNEVGLATGIEMIPHPLANPERPGFNSLGIVRDIALYSGDVKAGAKRIADHQRGTAWIYAMADASGEGIMAETVRSLPAGSPFPYYGDGKVPGYWRKRIPTPDELDVLNAKEGNPPHDRGVIARGMGYRMPAELVALNKKLFSAYNWNLRARVREMLVKLLGLFMGLFGLQYKSLIRFFRDYFRALFPMIRYRVRDFGPDGFICKKPADDNSPGPYYYPPERRHHEGFLMVTNHCMSAEMRTSAMNEWIALLSGEMQNDFQWRYDELSSLATKLFKEKTGSVDHDEAWDLINYLRSDPDGPCPWYYAMDIPAWKKRKNPDYWKNILVHGSVNLCELKERSLKSLWGYYGDKAVSIQSLDAYRC